MQNQIESLQENIDGIIRACEALEKRISNQDQAIQALIEVVKESSKRIDTLEMALGNVLRVKTKIIWGGKQIEI